MAKITAKNIDKLDIGQHLCPLVPGLNLRVGERRKTWVLRYKDTARRSHRINLGFYPAVTLSDAREEARKEKERIQKGLVPTASVLHPTSSKQLTMGGLIDQYEAARRLKKEKIKTLDERLKTVRNNLGKHLDRPAALFNDADVRALRDEIAARAPVMSNAFLRYLKPIIRWAVSEAKLTVNVVRDIQEVGPSESRDRYLDKEEIVKLWKATDTDKPYHRLLRFLLLTGARLEEASTMRHGDIIDGVWHQGDNKIDTPVRHKLSRAALAIVGTGDKHQFVFPGRLSGRPMSGWSRFKKTLDKTSGISAWRQHDLRRTMSSHMQDLGIPPHIIDLCQVHVVAGVRGIYQRAELLDQKLDAWEKWAAEINSLVDTGEMRGQSAESSR